MEVAPESSSVISNTTQVLEHRYFTSLTGRCSANRRGVWSTDSVLVQGFDNTTLFLREGERKTASTLNCSGKASSGK